MRPPSSRPRAKKPAAPTALTTPSLTGPLAGNPNPISFDAGPLGPVYLTGIVSGLALWQNNPFPGDQRSLGSLSNGQFIFQKTDGILQYYVQAGAYTIPALGTPYFNTPKATGDFFSALPVANLKLAPTDAFSIQGGKLPTLIGAEYTFTFQNMNIERGLLWNQEPAVSRGAQLNYTADPLAFSFSWNDGFYSNQFTWLTGSLAYTLDKENTFTIAAGGNYAHSTKVTTTTPFNLTTATPLFQNNETILNLIYTYNSAPWTITPYFQYTNVPGNSSPPFNTFSSASTYGGAILVNYSFPDDSLLPGFSLPLRIRVYLEYGQSREWRTQPDLWSRQQCVVGHPDADLSVQDLFRARRVLPRRNQQHDARLRAWPHLRQYDADALSVRNRCSVLSCRARGRDTQLPARCQRGHRVRRQVGALDVAAVPQRVEQEIPGGARGVLVGRRGEQPLDGVRPTNFLHRG